MHQGTEQSSSHTPILYLHNCPAREQGRKRITTEPLQNLMASWMSPLWSLSHTDHKNQGNGNKFQLTGIRSENIHITPIRCTPRQNMWYQPVWHCLSLQKKWEETPLSALLMCQALHFTFSTLCDHTKFFQMWGSYDHPDFLIRRRRVKEPN